MFLLTENKLVQPTFQLFFALFHVGATSARALARNVMRHVHLRPATQRQPAYPTTKKEVLVDVSSYTTCSSLAPRARARVLQPHQDAELDAVIGENAVDFRLAQRTSASSTLQQHPPIVRGAQFSLLKQIGVVRAFGWGGVVYDVFHSTRKIAEVELHLSGDNAQPRLVQVLAARHVKNAALRLKAERRVGGRVAPRHGTN